MRRFSRRSGRIGRRFSRRLFSKYARRTHRRNVRVVPFGGYRL